MAERTSWAVGSDTERILTVEDARIAWGGLLTPAGAVAARSGFRPTGNADPGKVFATSPTPNGTVHVEPFTYHLQSVRGGGVYTMTLDAVKRVNILAAAPPDSSNARHDLIVAQQSDLFFGDSDSRMRIRHVVGAPSGSPQDPTVTGSPDVIRLARIVVGANATTITDTDIEGLRPVDRATVGLGGVLPIPDQEARTAIADPYDGMTIYRRDRNWLEVFDGAGWRVAGVAHCSSIGDRDAVITSPHSGQLVVTTDTATLWVRHTGVWQRAAGESVTDRRAAGFGTTTSTAYTTVLSNGQVAGVAFTAPASGRVRIDNAAYMWGGGNNQGAVCTIQVRTGPTIGTGTVILPASDDKALITNDPFGVTLSRPYLLTSLTPWSTYNVQQLVRVGAGTGTFNRHALTITPA